MRNGLTIYCIRHGETDWNAAFRYQGQADVPLNNKGRAQARRNGKTLGTLLPDLSQLDFVASPLGRTRETMSIARNALGLPADDYAVDDRLREVHYGHWEGKLLSELPQIDPEGMAARATDPFHWCPRGGESYAHLSDRVGEWLETIERDTVVVTHGGISRTLRGHLLNFDMNGILQMEVPQDRILKISHAGMEWL